MPTVVLNQPIRRGEWRKLTGSIAAAIVDGVQGTVTIQSSPAPTFTLYDAAGVAITALTNVFISTYNAGALALARIWYVLNTVTPVNLPAGKYVGVINVAVLASDGSLSDYEISIEFSIIEPYA